MANNIMKWWRSKFLNNYKQLSVECSNGKSSDTEELLGRLNIEDNANDRLRNSCTTPPIRCRLSTSSPTNSAKSRKSPLPKESPVHHHLNLEEFTCDVSLEEAKPAQEFSFTLYDFDGHGKITKDDINGLVSTIYDVLGSSVKVPHYGSKTIQVKLTVSPDSKKYVCATVIDEKNKENEAGVSDKHNLNVTIRKNKEGRRRCRKTKQVNKVYHCCKKHEEEEVEQKPACVSEESDISSRISRNISSDDDEEGECSDVEFKQKPKQKKHVGTQSPKHLAQTQEVSQYEMCQKIKRTKKRSGSLQRQELLEIIQANMDKNNSFQTARKHPNHVSPERKQPCQTEMRQAHSSEIKQYKHQQKSPAKVAQQPLNFFTDMVDPAHFYTDLASLQNITQFPRTPHQYNKLVDAVMCVSNDRAQYKTQRCRKHNHSRSVELTDLPHNFPELDYPVINEENMAYRQSKRYQKHHEQEQNRKNSRKCPQGVIGHTSAPHHLRHKNRQENQARAMAQVVSWLEQEFSKDHKEKQEKHTHEENHKETSENTPTSTPSVERHEHHHVHEHIHHHYHHYQDSPVVV